MGAVEAPEGRSRMAVLALVLAILGLGFLTLLWVSVLLSLARIAWRGAFRTTG